MSTSPTPKTELMTADEFFDWCHRPENEARQWELERGKVVEASRPSERHCAACANVTRLLGNYVWQRRKGYVCGNDTGVVWERGPDTVRGADIILYDRSAKFEEMNPKYSEEVPTLAVEVLSPTDRP